MLTGGADYDSGPYNVTFPAGVTNIPCDVPITNDIILEGDEYFYLIIDPSSQPNGVSVSNPDHATVTIVDDDGKHLLLLHIHSLLCITMYMHMMTS